MGFLKQEYWSGLLFSSPGDLPNPGIELRSPALQADALPSEPQGKPTSSPEEETKDRAVASLAAGLRVTLPSLGFSFLIRQVSISDHLSAKSKGLEGESERAFGVTGCHRAREERHEQKRIKNSGLGGLELESQLWGQPSASVSPSV